MFGSLSLSTDFFDKEAIAARRVWFPACRKKTMQHDKAAAAAAAAAPYNKGETAISGLAARSESIFRPFHL